MELCNLCDDALRYCQHTSTCDKSVHCSYLSFLAAVDAGCYICQGLFSQVPEEGRRELRRRAETSVPPPEKCRKVDDSQQGLTSYRRKFENSRNGCIWLDLRMVGLSGDAPFLFATTIKHHPSQYCYPVAAETITWTDTSTSTKSMETFTKIKTWLDRCGKGHKHCSSRRGEADVGWHPTRLVEIAPGPEPCEDSNDLRCRIVELNSEILSQDLRYITLSHHWPQDQHSQGFQKLTVHKLSDWKASLPVRMLRQTFRDTFLVAQRLGISYVWIDSLCIIQEGDDYEDWRKEAPMMQKVYSNAEFNICASKNDQDEGLFSSRTPSSPQPLQIDFPQFDDPDGDDDSGHYLIRKEPPINIWELSMKNSPLASRGWVFQEQLLSRTNLHYGEHEVFFECPEMRASESLGSDQDYQSGWRIGGHFFKERLPISTGMEGRAVCSEENSVSDSDCKADYLDYKRWHDLLSRYTSRQLTNSDDRLVALSGVAHYFKNFLHDDCYIAGLWRSRLATEMLWQLVEDPSRETLERRKNRDRHLTFSWASVEGKIESKAEWHHDSESDVHLAELKPIKYRVPSDAMDATGFQGQLFAEDIFSLPPTPTVEIRLTGFLRPMILKQTTKQWRIWPGTREWTREESASFCLRWRKDPWLDDQTRLDFEMSSSELDALNTSGRLFFMPLIGRDNISVRLLLLELVETGDGKDMGRFRRIGIHNYSLDLVSLDKWLSLYVFSEDFFRNLSCGEYVDRSTKHTIFVI